MEMTPGSKRRSTKAADRPVVRERDKPFDIEAKNPRYRGATMSDVARALLRRRNVAARAQIERPPASQPGHKEEDSR